MSEQPPRDPHDPAEDETVIVPPEEASLEETVVADSWGPEEEVFVEEREEVVPAAPPRRRPPLLWPGLLALLLLVLGGTLAFVLLSGDDDDESAAPTTTTARSVSVPDVVGSPEEQATAALRAAGFEVNVANVPSDEPVGTVVAQDPAGGVEADEGSTVRVNVAEEPEQTTPAETAPPPATTAPPPTTEPPPATTTEPPPATTTAPPEPEPAIVPDVVDQELANAARAFGDEGLKVSVRYVPSDRPLGTVVAQAQDPGTELERGDTVQVNVSPGAEPPPNANVPDVAGRREPVARNELERAQFEVLAIELEGGRRGVVISHTPPGGAAVPRGSLVILYVGAG
ncbi:MAG TPA: PASTA domain-containing protein [Gaiellaceae bacterium]|nr:PASTA domain-containing protein [Gaiellaceae bacterium]